MWITASCIVQVAIFSLRNFNIDRSEALKSTRTVIGFDTVLRLKERVWQVSRLQINSLLSVMRTKVN